MAAAAKTARVEFLTKTTVHVGKGGKVTQVVYEEGSVHELHALDAARFVKSGRARPTKKPADK